jgi:hypothetical protein
MSNNNGVNDKLISQKDTDSKSIPVDPPTQPTTSENAFDEQMQSVLDLLYQRVDGAVSNERIESEVDRILQSQQQLPRGPPVTTIANPASSSAHSVVVPDMENYDDDDDETDVPMKNPAKPCFNVKTDQKSRNVATFPSSNENEDQVEEMDWSIYDGIPLGRQGAQMMTAFGDGKVPQPAAVRAALLGARRKLQTTLQDARHIRRKQKALYRSAKNAIKAERPEKPGDYKKEWSSELLFRAAIGYDPLAFDPKCGFGLEDLYKLHPEEMNAYNRWNEMHGSATEATENGEDVTPTTEDTPSASSTTPEMVVGHLQERAAQFDVRTYKMPSAWYMQYSTLRQKGTFLPRTRRGAGTAALDAEWESTTRQKRPVGSKGGAPGWAHMSATAVRFLHWLGFDPASALPPPNDDVTAALAFLAYDFFGRIVEKAIFLRKVQRQAEAGVEVNETAITYELNEGEQLTEEDIARAMEDPDIQPAPLYSTGDTALGPQLYFGPGFEDRLEMEMEEMLWQSKEHPPLSEEELRIRQQEAALFSEISKPPTQDGIAALLARPQGDKYDSSAVPTTQPRTRTSKRTKR